MALLCCGGHCAGILVPSDKTVTANQYKVVLTDHFHPMMKYFYPDESGLSRMTMLPSIGHDGFDEYENYVNHMLWPSQSPHLNPI